MAAETVKVTEANALSVIPVLLWSWKLILCSPASSPGGEYQEKSKQALLNVNIATDFSNSTTSFLCTEDFFLLESPAEPENQESVHQNKKQPFQATSCIYSVCHDDVVRTDLIARMS